MPLHRAVVGLSTAQIVIFWHKLTGKSEKKEMAVSNKQLQILDPMMRTGRDRSPGVSKRQDDPP